MSTKRYLSTGVLAAWAVLSLAGCSKKTEQASTSSAEGRSSTAPSGREAANQDMALVRFVNATPGQADLWFGNDQAFTNVAYKTVTPYKELPGKREQFTLRSAGASESQAKATNSEGLNKGAHYTVVALLDKDGKTKLNVINDNLSEPENGRAKVRVVNASQDEVDVYSPVSRNERGVADRMKQGAADRLNPKATRLNEDKWFGGVDADSATSYKDVDAVNSTLRVRPTSAKNSARAGVMVPVDFAAGKLYTLIVTGGHRREPLEVVRVVDELGAQRSARTQ